MKAAVAFMILFSALWTAIAARQRYVIVSFADEEGRTFERHEADCACGHRIVAFHEVTEPLITWYSMTKKDELIARAAYPMVCDRCGAVSISEVEAAPAFRVKKVEAGL